MTETALVTKPRPYLNQPVRAVDIFGGTANNPDDLLRDRLTAVANKAKDERPAPSLEQRRPCWALTQPGPICTGSMHSDGKESWPCRALRVRLEQARLKKLLTECKVPSSYDGPISPILAMSYEHDRPLRVERWDTRSEVPLSEMIALAHAEATEVMLKNALLHGPTGTGKTHIELLIYFTALECGVDAVWIDDKELRPLVADLASFDEEIKRAAETRWSLLCRRKVIFYSDLGLDDDPPRESKPSHPLLAGHLWKLLEEGTACVRATTNLPPRRAEGDDRRIGSLSEHPDVGPRVLSRLTGSRTDDAALASMFAKAIAEKRQPTVEERAACVHPALILKFSPTGEGVSDQRLHAGVMQRRALRSQR